VCERERETWSVAFSGEQKNEGLSGQVAEYNILREERSGTMLKKITY
jgi:hypothetical protein